MRLIVQHLVAATDHSSYFATAVSLVLLIHAIVVHFHALEHLERAVSFLVVFKPVKRAYELQRTH